MTYSAKLISSNLTEAALLKGPDDLLADFDRAYHVFQSLVSSCRALSDIGAAVTVFGSARLKETHPYYLRDGNPDSNRQTSCLPAHHDGE